MSTVSQGGGWQQRGQASERSSQDGFFGGGSVEFFRILDEWRAGGALEGLELKE